MRSLAVSLAWVLAAAGALTPQQANAQAFTADYGLAPVRPGALELGPVRINPVLQADARYSGAGLSLDAGRDWFARVGVGRELAQPSFSFNSASAHVLSIGGGYRFSGGRSLSLQLNRGGPSDRLGLAVSYDWPRYFVRLSYDTMLAPQQPQDRLRFSAGVRF